jgi:hypothetical protein
MRYEFVPKWMDAATGLKAIEGTGDLPLKRATPPVKYYTVMFYYVFYFIFLMMPKGIQPCH